MAWLLQYILFVSLTSTSMWSMGHCQGVQAILQKLEEMKPFQEALKEHPEIINELSRAAETVSQLWTVHLWSVLENTSNSSVSQQCVESAESIIAATFRPNVTIPAIVSLLDATGKPGPGILSGNLIMNAAFDECFMYNFTGYCGGSAKISFIPGLTWTLGLCVPKHCTPQDVARVMTDTEIFDVDDSLMLCTDSKWPKYSAGAIIMIVVSSIFAGLVLLGTALDKIMACFALYGSYKRYGCDEDIAVCVLDVCNEKPHTNENCTPKINDNSTASGGSIISASNEKSPLLTTPRTQLKRSCCGHGVKWHNFLTAFSLYRTVPTLLATKQAPGVITSLNGLRVMSIFWVILGHSYALNIAGIDNAGPFMGVMSRFTAQAVENALFAVDSFFFLSGVLVAYLTLRQMKKNGRFPFLHYYIHRYLRLTPTYAFVLFFGWHLGNHLVSSPIFAVTNILAEACSKNWWTNLLYINNLYPWKLADECMPWAWYLANDMQFFVLAPLVILPFYYLIPLGLTVAGVMLFCAFTITAALVGVYDFQGSGDTAQIAYNYHTNITAEYSDFIYVKPWSRISPYIVGLLLGFILYKEIRLPFGRIKNIPFYLMMWFASGFLLVSTVYGMYFIWHGHVPSVGENIMYITFSRCAWSVGLALLVFACHNRYGGLINTFLSMKIWTPLSRLTFNAYLVHPLILTIIYGQLEKPIHYTDVTLATFFVAFVVFSYAVAAVLCVCVEFPLGSVEMLLFKLVGLGGRQSQRQGGTIKGVVEGKRKKLEQEA